MSRVASLLTMGCICAKDTIVVGDRHFVERSRLGEGGFSYVDLVEDRSSRRLFALKRLSCHSDEDLKTARHEAEYMLGFAHQNLAPCEVYAVHEVTGSRTGVTSEVFIVMPFYWNGTLQDDIEKLNRKCEQMDEVRLVRLLGGICDGLRALHTHYPLPVTHRDLKPANIMLDSDDRPVLMDFGSMGPATVQVTSSRQARVLEDTAAERCSMPYRAPELFHVQTDSVLTDRIDIWSLGCTVYAMCFHESPFEKAYQRGDSIALAVLGGNIHIPESSIYSKELTNLILSMLVVNAEQRPSIDVIIQRLASIPLRHSNCI